MKLCRGRSWMCAALGVILSVAVIAPADAALFGLWKRSKARNAEVARKLSVVIFPFDQTEVTRVPTAFGEYIATDLRNMVSESNRYIVVLYREKLAPIARARAENVLRPEDVAPPFGEDKSKAVKLTQILAGDMLIIGTVDDYQVDRAAKSAMVTLSAQLVDAKSGKVIKVLTVTGRTPESLRSDEEEELRDFAKGDAVNKLAAEIVGVKKAAEHEGEASSSEPGVEAKPSSQPEAGANAPAAPNQRAE